MTKPPYKELFFAAMRVLCSDVAYSHKKGTLYDHLCRLMEKHEVSCPCGYTGKRLVEANEKGKELDRSYSLQMVPLDYAGVTIFGGGGGGNSG